MGRYFAHDTHKIERNHRARSRSSRGFVLDWHGGTHRYRELRSEHICSLGARNRAGWGARSHLDVNNSRINFQYLVVWFRVRFRLTIGDFC